MKLNLAAKFGIKKCLLFLHDKLKTIICPNQEELLNKYSEYISCCTVFIKKKSTNLPR